MRKDDKAPNALTIPIADNNGQTFGTVVAGKKDFSTGSTGYYASGRIINPASGLPYQVTMSIVLIGSKPA